MNFSKALAKYYLQWFRDSHDSAVYCRNKGEEKRALEYLEDANKYFNIINENWEAIVEEEKK